MKEICPNCNSSNLKIEKINEFTNADGNMGVIITYVECLNCGWIESNQI